MLGILSDRNRRGGGWDGERHTHSAHSNAVDKNSDFTYILPMGFATTQREMNPLEMRDKGVRRRTDDLVFVGEMRGLNGRGRRMYSRCDGDLRVLQNTNLEERFVTSFLRKMKKGKGLVELGNMNPALCCISSFRFYHQ